MDCKPEKKHRNPTAYAAIFLSKTGTDRTQLKPGLFHEEGLPK
jgi:hypothetical protein